MRATICIVVVIDIVSSSKLKIQTFFQKIPKSDVMCDCIRQKVMSTHPSVDENTVSIDVSTGTYSYVASRSKTKNNKRQGESHAKR